MVIQLPPWSAVCRDDVCTKHRTVLPVVQGLPLKTKDKNWFIRQKAWLWDARRWEVIRHYYFKFIDDTFVDDVLIPAGTVLVIPAGFCSDFASSPRIFWPIGMDPVGILQVPSLFHDFGYRHDFYIDQSGLIIFNGYGKRFHDTLFREICEQINNMDTPGLLAYVALDVAGWYAWWRSSIDRKVRIHVLDLEGTYNG